MKFEFYVSSAAVTAISSLIAAVVSASIAKRTAENTANKEIEKMMLGWKREDIVSTDDDFATIVEAITTFLHFRDSRSQLKAAQCVSIVRAKENGALAPIVDDLYSCVQAGQYDSVELLTTSAIEAKRHIKNKELVEC